MIKILLGLGVSVSLLKMVDLLQEIKNEGLSLVLRTVLVLFLMFLVGNGVVGIV